MTSRQTHKSKPLTLGDVALHLAGLMNRVRAIENLTAVDQRPVEFAVPVIRWIGKRIAIMDAALREHTS